MTDQPNTARLNHVLVVDDNVELARTYQELLQSHDYRVTTAHDGVHALKFIQDADVDAILCDLSMPQLEGDMFYYAAQRVRPELTRRFIFVTGQAENPKYNAFLKQTGVPVLSKPVPVNGLLDALKNIFAGQPQS